MSSGKLHEVVPAASWNGPESMATSTFDTAPSSAAVPVIVLVPSSRPPLAGDVILMSGGKSGPPQPGKLKDAMRVAQFPALLLLLYSVVYQKVQSSDGSIDMLL